MSKKNNVSERIIYVDPNECTLGTPLIGVTRHATYRGGPWCDTQTLQDNIVMPPVRKVTMCMYGAKEVLRATLRLMKAILWGWSERKPQNASYRQECSFPCLKWRFCLILMIEVLSKKCNWGFSNNSRNIIINQEMQPTKLVKVCGNINPISGTWPLTFHGEVA